MERDDFARICAVLKAAYTAQSFLPDKESIELWYGFLKDLPYDRVAVAVQSYIMVNRFPPTIADIRKSVVDLGTRADDSMSEMEAWSCVRKAIARSSYHSVEEFEALPTPCKKAVGSPDNLREWSQMETETVNSVIHSNFLRAYRTVTERVREEAAISAPVMARIAQIRGDGALIDKGVS